MKSIVDKVSPITGREVQLRTEMATVVYRGETISYEKSFYHCVDSGLDFSDEDLEAENLKHIYDTYRRLHSIPTAEELKALRMRYNIPESAMSVILGLGVNQYGLYEDGAVPSVSVGKLLQLAMEPSNFYKMLVSSRLSFSDKQYAKYYLAVSAALPMISYEKEVSRMNDYALVPSATLLPLSIKTKRRAKPERFEPYYSYAYGTSC